MTDAATAAEVTDDVSAVVAGATARYLTFTLRGETYALDILEVTEIIEFRPVTAVPMMPAFIRGVINLRGRVLPVIDLNARFGQGLTDIGRRTGIIVLEVEVPAGDGEGTTRRGVGIVVDAVNKVVHLSADDIEPPPAFGAGIRTESIRGMAKLDGEFVVILEVGDVVSVDDIAQLDQAGRRLSDLADVAG